MATLKDHPPGTFAKANPRHKSAFTLRLEAMDDALPMTVRCMVDGCRFRWSGSALEAREQAREHRRDEHPDRPIKARRPKRPPKTRYEQTPEDKAILAKLAKEQSMRRSEGLRVNGRARSAQQQSFISAAREAAAWRLYEAGLSTSQISQLAWKTWGYSTPNSCRKSLGAVFKANGRALRAQEHANRASWTVPELNRSEALAILQEAEDGR